MLYNLATTHNAQAVKADSWFYWSQNEKLEPCHVISEGLCGKLVNPQKEFESFYAKPSIWSGMYNRAFLKETIFASWKRRAPFAPHAPLPPRIVRGAPRQAQASVCRVSPGKPSRERPRRPGAPQRFGQHPQQRPPLAVVLQHSSPARVFPAGGKAASFAAGARSAERVRQRCFGTFARELSAHRGRSPQDPQPTLPPTRQPGTWTTTMNPNRRPTSSRETAWLP